MNNRTTYLSKKGMKQLKKEVADLERDRRRIIVELHEQDKKSSHDERLERVEKLARLDSVEQQLLEKKDLLQSAKPYPRKNASRVSIGSVVELINSNGKRFIYTIVDSVEANPSDGRISTASPLGRTLLGKTISDTVDWSIRSKSKKLQLVRIS